MPLPTPFARFAAVPALAAMLLAGPPAGAGEASSEARLGELRKSFTLDGQPVPPQVFRDFGDGDLADSGAIWLTVDLRAAIGSNLYFADVTTREGWRTQVRHDEDTKLDETSSYRFIGTTKDKLLIAVSAFSGGGSGMFYTLHVMDAAIAPGFDNDGKRYDRIALTNLRSLALGDRWNGTVAIDGDRITVTTEPGTPANTEDKTQTTSFTAERP